VTCAYCGRDNDAGAQFCMDCGKPVGKASGVKAVAAVATPAAPVVTRDTVGTASAPCAARR